MPTPTISTQFHRSLSYRTSSASGTSFPNAPRIPVTINMGLIMRAWYDISELDGRGQDEKRIRQSAVWISELVTREGERGIAASRVVLAGFSQGGAMALFAGLRHPENIGGNDVSVWIPPVAPDVARGGNGGKPALVGLPGPRHAGPRRRL